MASRSPGFLGNETRLHCIQISYPFLCPGHFFILSCNLLDRQEKFGSLFSHFEGEDRFVLLFHWPQPVFKAANVNQTGKWFEDFTNFLMPNIERLFVLLLFVYLLYVLEMA